MQNGASIPPWRTHHVMHMLQLACVSQSQCASASARLRTCIFGRAIVQWDDDAFLVMLFCVIMEFSGDCGRVCACAMCARRDYLVLAMCCGAAAAATRAKANSTTILS